MTFAAMTAKRIGKCRICGDAYVKRSMTHVACSIRCAHELARLKRQKAEAHQAKLERQDDKVRKEKLKTRSDYIRDAQIACNSVVRERDRQAGHPCISSGKPLDWTGNATDAGHYRSRGSAPHLRFNLWNIRTQSKQENRYNAGNAIDYRINLIARIGLAKVEALEADNEPRKHDIAWLKRFTALMRKKLRRMKARAA
jgi:hypothetical protein